MIKRLFDIFMSVLGLFILSPLLMFIFFLVLFKLGSPVFFKQQRPGLNGKIFKMYKFRTMTNEKDKEGVLLPNAQRMTRLGLFLRKTSLDELPELLNVISGKMSIVGPRPLLVDYLSLYNEFQQRRHEVKPGITGWAQVNGRNALSWDEKFAFDVWYVDHHSFLLDLKILFKTVKQVFKRDGITHEGDVAMPRFTGSDPFLNANNSE
jgi:lipopolysaccharide/colanic/teichoic acid biosynthesis glycosyltransferase